jgi:hypothetical protein
MPRALPVFTVNSEEEARELQIALCRLQYDGRHTLTDFGGHFEDLEKATDTLRRAYERFMVSR